jgi:hypothetical protein
MCKTICLCTSVPIWYHGGMTDIRPRFSLPDATAIRDTVQRVVIYNDLHNEFLSAEEVVILRDFADKLTLLTEMQKLKQSLKRD